MDYIAILRGINVGGKNKLPMVELRALAVDLGWLSVATYIQSGNLKFEAKEQDEMVLATALKQAIDQQFGYQIPILVRPQTYFQTLLQQHPALVEPVDPKHLHATFLAKAPEAAASRSLLEKDWGNDRIWIEERCAFLHCPNGYGRTKLTNSYLEKQLGVTATTRNWRTLNKLATW